MEEYDVGADCLKAHPPRLEDAGLEDTVLPPEGIQEAFHRAAEMVKSATVSRVDATEKDTGCVEDAGPSNGYWSDALVTPGLEGLQGLEGGCVDTEVGQAVSDKVAQGEGDVEEEGLVGGQEAGCIRPGEGSAKENKNLGVRQCPIPTVVDLLV